MGYWLVPLAYLLGGVPFGLLIARRYGVDIQQAGSGNIGATNVWRCCGPKAGAPALLLDIAKGLVPTALAVRFFPGQPTLHVAVGGAAVLGHTFSPYLRFTGGKAVATSLGACVAFAPIAAGCALVVFALTLAVSRYVSLASLLGGLAAVIGTWVVADPLAYSLVITVGVTLIWLRHRANLQRLLRGEESRFSIGGSRPAEAAEEASG